MVTGGDKSISAELIDIFRQQIREFSETMKDLHASGSFSELGQLAHKAKSSVAIMGMTNLAALLKEMELDCRQGTNTQNYIGIIGKFRDETAEAVNELDDYLLKL
jgi:HPt (histidine-containing phosphotransfer) domain-containing protein